MRLVAKETLQWYEKINRNTKMVHIHHLLLIYNYTEKCHTVIITLRQN